jgi:hypothetical protein
MSDFSQRILEMHSVHAWDFRLVQRAMDFAKTYGMNAICFHRNDFVDKLIYPSKYVGATRSGGYGRVSEIYKEVFRNVYKNDPLFRDVPYRNGVYFRKVLIEAERRGLQVYLETKEINFPDYLTRLHPQLCKNGALCPSEPFLTEFIEFKYAELFKLYPGIAGIFTSVATSESKTSFAVNHCSCDLCRNKKDSEWYRDVIMALYRPISAAGARLIIRDFVFDAKTHRGISAAMDALPLDIAYCMKNTPHDYYPTFPDNPRIGKVPGHDQVLEYDVFGQYFGLGVGIAVMLDDIRRRLRHAKDNGVSGVLVRTCWEGITGATVFDSPNLLSLYAIAAMSDNLAADEDDIYGHWLADQRYFAPGIDAGKRKATIAQVKAVFSGTWDVLRRTAYMNECVFNDSSHFPAGLDHAFWLAEVKNSLKDWDPTKALALSTHEPDNIRKILREKDEALALVTKLGENARRIGDGLTPEARKYMVDCLDAYLLYVRGFRFLAQGMILTKYFSTEKVDSSSEFFRFARKTLAEALAGLDQMHQEYLELWRTHTDYFYLTYTILDPERMIVVKEDLMRLLEGTAYA